MKIMVNSISPKDFYCVYNILMLQVKSQKLNLLYTTGSVAVNYIILGTKILGDRNLSKELFTL